MTTEREKFEEHCKIFDNDWDDLETRHDAMMALHDVCSWIAAEEARREQAAEHARAGSLSKGYVREIPLLGTVS